MKNINAFLKNQVNKRCTPSIQYVFFDTKSSIYELRYGLKNVLPKAETDSSTTYNLFSITKTFTALAILQLVQANKIELNQSVSYHLPEFPYSDKITIIQLLNHTAGIPSPTPLTWIHLPDEHLVFNSYKFFSNIFKANPKLDFEPGEKFKYSNLGYLILGNLIERVSGQSFERYVKENIIKQCCPGTSDLSFTLDPSIHATGYHKTWSLSNVALGFLLDKNKFMGNNEEGWKPFRFFYTNGPSYGGLFGSADGLTKYAQALLHPTSKLLNSDLKKVLFTENIINNKATGMALSWFAGTLKGNRYFTHAGGGGGYYTELRLYPELGAGSLIMYNRTGLNDERVLDQADSFFITENTSHKKAHTLFKN